MSDTAHCHTHIRKPLKEHANPANSDGSAG